MGGGVSHPANRSNSTDNHRMDSVRLWKNRSPAPPLSSTPNDDRECASRSENSNSVINSKSSHGNDKNTTNNNNNATGNTNTATPPGANGQALSSEGSQSRMSTPFAAREIKEPAPPLSQPPKPSAPRSAAAYRAICTSVNGDSPQVIDPSPLTAAATASGKTAASKLSATQKTAAVHDVDSAATLMKNAMLSAQPTHPDVQYRQQSGASSTAIPLSPRATDVVNRINDIIRRCEYYETMLDCGVGNPNNSSTPSHRADANGADKRSGSIGAYPTEEEQVMYEVLLSLFNTPIGPLFLIQPETSLSNRSCVLATPDFIKDEVVAGYTLGGAYTPGTVGRSYFSQRNVVLPTASSTRLSYGEGSAVPSGTTTTLGNSKSGVSSESRASSQPGTSFSLAEAKARKSAVQERDTLSFSVMKVVCFHLRKELVTEVISDQCVLTKLNCPQLLKVTDVLKDEYLEKVIIITNFQPRGNLAPVAGNLDADPERFRLISGDVALGLAALHANKVFHHNLKLENVLETYDGRYCVADAGFSRLFASQCPEALIFNGELACLPPEVFDVNGPYYAPELWSPVGDVALTSHHNNNNNNSSPKTTSGSGNATTTVETSRSSSTGAGIGIVIGTGIDTGASVTTVAAAASTGSNSHQESTSSPMVPSGSQSRLLISHQHAGVGKVDVWGYGILLYRLAFGRDPLEIAMRHFGEVRELVQHYEPVFPPKPTWPFYEDLVTVMKACMHKNPAKRPEMAELLKMPYFQDMGLFGSNAAHHSHHRSTSLVNSPGGGNGLGGSGVSGRAAGGRSQSNSGLMRNQNRSGYTVDAMLGTGRVSETILVHLRRNTSKRYAFKMLKNSLLKRTQSLTDTSKAANAVKTAHLHDAMRKLAICRKMSHPNIVPYVDVLDGKKGDCFVVQEYLRNGPLLAMPMPTSLNPRSPDMPRLLSDVLLALAYLHDNEITHLNLKPSNIFFDEAVGRFRVADFGPLFLTAEELVNAQARGKPIYSLPKWLLAEESTTLDPFHVDTFCVGLLAASATPTVFATVWRQFTCEQGHGPIEVPAVLRAVRSASKPLPPALVEFAAVALSGGSTPRELLQHAYFNGRFSASDAVAVERVEVSPEEIAAATRAKPQVRDEHRVVDVLGQDPFQDSQVLSSVVGDCDTSLSATDRSLLITFKGRNLRCEQCRAEMTVALYRCSTCPGILRCGKCTVNDTHHPGHTLVPYVIHTIEHNADGNSRAQLYHPSTIQDQHALETLEMGANFPVGALSGHVASQRLLERSVARSFVANNNNTDGTGLNLNGTLGNIGASQRLFFSGGDFGSTLNLPDPECSVSAIGARSTTSVKPMNSESNFTFGNHMGLKDQSVSGVGDTSSSGVGAAAGSSFTTNLAGASGTTGSRYSLQMQTQQPPNPPPASKGSMLKGSAKSVKKFALPKAADIEDLPWEDELRHCRENDMPELLLFNYSFTQVPPAVYTPPPLQVVFLDLSQNDLTSLPHELSFLAHLRKLVVSYNKLTELPDSMGNLVELESIDASHNKLTSLPMTFVYLTHLQSCALDYNKFTKVPECLVDILPPSGMPDTPTLTQTKFSNNNNTGEGNRKTSTSLRSSAVKAAENSGEEGEVVGEDEDDGDEIHEYDGAGVETPALSVLYLAANDGIVSLPPMESLRRFSSLKIALDNEPMLYRTYLDENWEAALSNVSISWNKIYPDEIISNLYCGSLRSAQSQMVYKKLKIGYVLTVGRGLSPVPPEGGKHKTIVVDDIPGADILSSVAEAIAFIKESQNAGVGCLVHCFAGLSRSATTVIAYLMVKHKMRLDEAYLVVKKGRPAILPNLGFFKQLIHLDGELYPKPSRSLDLGGLDRPADEDLAQHK